jgi:hypothetical protein
VALAATGTMGALDDGAPLRIAGCGRVLSLVLPAGAATVSAPAGSVLRPDYLLLDSRAPAPPPGPAAGTAALAAGLTASGVPRGATVHARGSAWLVLGESYSRGWRAYCSGAAGGERSLGPPLPIDGYANGWVVTPRCPRVRFAFAPQHIADFGYLVSLLAAPILLALIALSRPRKALPPAPPRRLGEADRLVRPGWLGALAAGTVSTLVIGFLFALPIGPLAVPILRLGTTARRLYTLGGTLLLAVPVAYLVRAAPDLGGFNFDYPYNNLVGHWLAVAGICLIAGGCLLQLWPVKTRGHSPPRRPSVTPGAHGSRGAPSTPLGATQAPR